MASEAREATAEMILAAAEPAAGDLHAETGAYDSHEGGGLPQLDTSTYAGQLFWLALTFVFLYLMMSRVALPRVASVLEERRERIAADLDKAEELRGESEAAVAAYEAALAEARAKAVRIANDTRARVQAEIDALKAETDAELKLKLTEAEARIEAMKESALAKVRGIAGEAMVAIVGQILGQSVDADTADRYVTAELNARG
ncbi:MAG: F0F1 ATP synthase subunit B' [Alphaproteobacteria bacterium]|nr:F0F1 ATP synthase subunit B' [Alphaproteobacteria bacterium]